MRYTKEVRGTLFNGVEAKVFRDGEKVTYETWGIWQRSPRALARKLAKGHKWADEMIKVLCEGEEG